MREQLINYFMPRLEGKIYFLALISILETITEILCHAPGDTCGGSDFYNCKQMKAKMLVGHTDREWRVRTLRNITINIGCSCVYREPVLLDQFSPGPEERRRKRTSVPRPFDLKSLQPQSPRR